MEGRQRVTLYDQMTAGDTSRRDSLANLILNDVVLANQKTEAAAENRSRTLLDIIREDEHNNTKDRKSWKALKDKLRLKRASSTVHIPVSDNNNRTLSQFLSHNSDAETHQQQNDVVDEDPENPAPISQEQFSSRTVDTPFDGGDSDDEDNNPETRTAVTAETAAAAVAGGPVSMSLMDLLEETDREMGFDGSRHRMSDDDDEDEDVDEYEEGEEKKGGEEGGVVEHNCCVCMVRHKGAAFIPCGHTFCRMCCRELWVSRGNCPLCNNFILEILDIF